MKEMAAAGEIKNVKDFLVFIRRELKPKGKIFTTFNVISLPIILLGGVLIIYPFGKRIGCSDQPFSGISLGDMDRI